MNPVKRGSQIQGHRSERVLDAARHFLRQLRIALAHFNGRVPIRPRLLAADSLRACPAEALPPDGDLIFVGAFVAKDVVELAPSCIDDNRVDGKVKREADDGRRLRRYVRASTAFANVGAVRAKPWLFPRLCRFGRLPAPLTLVSP